MKQNFTVRHGALDGAGSPALLAAIRPLVIVANNGPRKGLGLSSPPSYSYEKIAKLPGVEGIWQGHRALARPGRERLDYCRDRVGYVAAPADSR